MGPTYWNRSSFPHHGFSCCFSRLSISSLSMSLARIDSFLEVPVDITAFLNLDLLDEAKAEVHLAAAVWEV